MAVDTVRLLNTETTMDVWEHQTGILRDIGNGKCTSVQMATLTFENDAGSDGSLVLWAASFVGVHNEELEY